MRLLSALLVLGACWATLGCATSMPRMSALHEETLSDEDASDVYVPGRMSTIRRRPMLAT